MRSVLQGWVLALALTVTGAAQTLTMQVQPPVQPSPGRIMATVTGHVTCSDTQQPARFANVMLVNAEQSTEGSRQGFGFGFGRRVMARTDLEGNFTAQVEPGDYYVTATATGYVSPVAAAAARMGSGASEADLLRALPEVHVSDEGGGPVNLTLDRGGVISGKLEWDDGSPAAGVNVVAMAASSTSGAGQTDVRRLIEELGGGFGGFSGGFQASDDRGVFRISGLAAGSYVVRATVMTPSAEPSRGGFGERLSSIALYAPGRVRRSEAQTITLKAGEERDDVVFTIDLNALHTVSGHVGSADEAGTVASGMVRLTDTQDSTMTRMAQIQPDGSFAVQWVPAGTYTLSVTNASSSPEYGWGRGEQSSGTSATRFQQFQETMTVSDSDVTGVGVSLVPVATAQSQ